MMFFYFLVCVSVFWLNSSFAEEPHLRELGGGNVILRNSTNDVGMRVELEKGIEAAYMDPRDKYTSLIAQYRVGRYDRTDSKEYNVAIYSHGIRANVVYVNTSSEYLTERLDQVRKDLYKDFVGFEDGTAYVEYYKDPLKVKIMLVRGAHFPKF